MPGMLAAAGSQLCLSGNYPLWKGAAFLACGSTPYLGAAPIWNLALMGVQTPLEWVAMSPPQGILLTQGLNPHLLCCLHCPAGS